MMGGSTKLEGVISLGCVVVVVDASKVPVARVEERMVAEVGTVELSRGGRVKYGTWVVVLREHRRYFVSERC